MNSCEQCPFRAGSGQANHRSFLAMRIGLEVLAGNNRNPRCMGKPADECGSAMFLARQCRAKGWFRTVDGRKLAVLAQVRLNAFGRGQIPESNRQFYGRQFVVILRLIEELRLQLGISDRFFRFVVDSTGWEEMYRHTLDGIRSSGEGTR